MSDSTEVNVAARRAAVGARRPFFRRRKSCPFSGPERAKNRLQGRALLSRFLSERGKIVPSRITAVSARSSASWRRPSSAPVSWPSSPTSSRKGTRSWHKSNSSSCSASRNSARWVTW